MIRHLFLASLSFGMAMMVAAPAMAETAKGEVKLAESDFGPPDDAPQIKLGETVTLEGTLYITDFFDRKMVTANAKVKNTGDKPMFIVYHVAVFDKDGNLLGATSQGSFGDEGLAAGEETQLGSLLIGLPADAMEKVSSYQATFYESDQPF